MIRVLAVTAGAVLGGVVLGGLCVAACFGYFVARGEAGVNGGGIAVMIALAVGAVGLVVGAVLGGVVMARVTAPSPSPPPR